jgi:UPF0042 nucleotide-binding protein
MHEAAHAELVSFGYLHGVPPDAHVIIDVRDHLRDPHASPGLRHLDAASPRVRDAVLRTPGAANLATAIARAAQALLAGIAPAPVIIAIGCAGGRHRSAVLADTAAGLLRQWAIPVTVSHRDIHRPVVTRQGISGQVRLRHFSPRPAPQFLAHLQRQGGRPDGETARPPPPL